MYTRVTREAFIQFALLFTILLCSFVIASSVARAQSLLDENFGVHLIPSPEFPGPNTQVRISLDDYSVESTGASILWSVNGIEQKQLHNERNIVIQTGALGEKTVVRVALTRANAPALTSSLTLTPTVIDLVLEAHTYVPDFYKGRALPSGESTIRAIAVVHDNSATPDTAYTYKWSVGSTVLFGGPVKGKNVFDYKIPLFMNGNLEVEVYNTDGEIIGTRSNPLFTAEPELHFYEHNPLRGLSEKEVTNPLTLIGEETTIHGEPYFINSRMNESDATFTWKINGVETSHDTDTPNAITLRHVGGEGQAEIGLTVITKRKIPQFVDKVFQLIFQ